MKVPYSWLGEFVGLSGSPEETAELLTAAGMKVEKIHRPAQGVEGVVVGSVLAIEPHPKADRLILAEVDLGSHSPQRKIVCGATNFNVGDRVPVALPGAKLPGIGVLEARAFRGVMSEGMLCSAGELGISDDHSGIMVLPATAEVGTAIHEALGMEDVVLELEITPNRPDAMSLVGIAGEVAACTGASLKPFSVTLPQSSHPPRSVKVNVLDEAGCPRYLARVIDGVEIADSPEWVKRRLRLAGIKPISNVVDATNYALWVTGHPMHAFDLDKLSESTIIVRRAESAETIITIDEEQRSLDPDDLVIADKSGPVALAGIMGGSETGINPSTKRVILESAYFDPASIFRSSQRHGVRSESSARFERGADPNNVGEAADFATSLILDWAGGSIEESPIDFYPVPVQPVRLSVRASRATAILGMDVDPEMIADALGRLGLDPRADGDVVTVTVPTRRRDLALEEDLIEEIARVIGYDSIPTTLPAGSNRAGGLPERDRFVRRLKEALVGTGLFEARTSILMGPADCELVAASSDLLRITNPLTTDESILRSSLMPGLLHAAARNFNRRINDVCLFETGTVFALSSDGPAEPLTVGVVMGGRLEQQWFDSSRPIDFFDLKGVVETLMDALLIRNVSYPEWSGPPFHPTRASAASVGGKRLGHFGELSPETVLKMDLPHPVYIGEFDVEAMFALQQDPDPAEETGRFPAVFLDLAVSVPEAARWSDIEETVRLTAGPALEGLRLIDVYRGKQIDPGHKSLAFSLTFRSAERTLTEAEALDARNRVAEALGADHHGVVRQ